MADETADAVEEVDETADSIDDVVTPLELEDEDAFELAQRGTHARKNLSLTLRRVVEDLDEDPPVVKLASLAALDESLDDLKAFTSRFREVTGEMVDHPNGDDHE